MPARLEIDGGVPLRGSVAASGAKNAALPALAASILTEEPVRLTNAPSLVDVRTMGRLLETLGATVRREGGELTARVAVIRGVARYQGAPVMASDLRASAALVLAVLAAQGRTTVSRVFHLDRGYERLEVKLAALGARIERRA